MPAADRFIITLPLSVEPLLLELLNERVTTLPTVHARGAATGDYLVGLVKAEAARLGIKAPEKGEAPAKGLAPRLLAPSTPEAVRAAAPALPPGLKPRMVPQYHQGIAARLNGTPKAKNPYQGTRGIAGGRRLAWDRGWDSGKPVIGSPKTTRRPPEPSEED